MIMIFYINLFISIAIFKIIYYMIFVELKENETVDRMLKRFKKKIDRVGDLKQARKIMYYTKPTTRRKEAIKKAIYKQKMYGNQ